MSREEARKRLEVYLICAQCPEDKQCYDSHLHSTCEYNDCREEVSLAEAIKTAIKALEQETCEDAISRQDALNCITATGLKKFDYILNARDKIKNLPPVKPQEPKSGHWEIIPCGNNHGEYRPPKYMCSECGWEIDLCRGLQQDTGHRLFCEHCGARMEGET